MASTDKSTPNYVTPLRRSLGLSRRLKGSTGTGSPITPSSTTTPLRASCNYNSPSIITTNNENLNITPASLSTTPQLSKFQMSPLKSRSTNRTESSKRIFRLSLNKSKITELPMMKKKRLDFLDNSNTIDDEIECSQLMSKIVSFENVRSTTNIEETEDDYISSSQMVTSEILTHIPNSELESNVELATELREIERLKQKYYRKRISYGLTVREDKLKDIDELRASIEIKDMCKQTGESNVIEFHTARQEIETTKIIPDSNTKQNNRDEEIAEIKNLIKIWRRGLRDAVEYLSCLSYPPTDIQTILRHHDIPPDLLIDNNN